MLEEYKCLPSVAKQSGACSCHLLLLTPRTLHFYTQIICVFCMVVTIGWAGVAQSVQLLAMDRTVAVSNPGGRRDFPHSSRPDLGSTHPPI